MKKLSAGLRDSLIGVALFALFAVFGTISNESAAMTLSAIIINILFALSYNLLFGYGGMMSLGHSLYYGMGSYFLLIYIMKAGFSLSVSLVLTLATNIIFAVIMGFICLKNGVVTFAFLSMGIGVTVCTMFKKWAWIGSDVGLQVNFRPAWMEDYRVTYLVILAIAALSCVAVYFLTKSPFIAQVQSLRENEERLTFIGVNTQKLRLVLFVVSAFFAGIAGILSAFRNNGAFVSSLENTVATQAVIMCMIGGESNFFGPVLGAVIVTLFYNYLSGVTIYFQGILGVVVLLVVYFMRDGLISQKMLLTLKKFAGHLSRKPSVTEGEK